MKPLKPVELFLSLSLTATLTACGGTSTTDGPERQGTQTDTPKTAETTDEGGEAGRSDSSDNLDPDVSYMITLGLMKGHLIVGKELLTAKNYEQAEPHIGHPVEELYGDIEAELPQRNVQDFKRTLNQLHDLVQSVPDSPEVSTQYETVLESINTAIEALPPEQLKSPQFVLETINGMLAVAGEEYAASMVDGKFVELVEYQDSRGFVLYALELYNAVSEQVEQENSQAAQVIKSSLDELTKAWPSVDLPEAPIMMPEEVSKLIETIRQESENLT